MKIILSTLIATIISVPVMAEIINLRCLASVNDGPFDVSVRMLDNIALLTIDGNEIGLSRDDQANDYIAFYRFDPWYRLTIDWPQFAPQRYMLGIPTDGDSAFYANCEEI
ncbi:MAG: hypothetical protein FWG80_00235 [Alphaproteobacteria bacterium]|nr:hypothetical protein [Alphaproteobacteria bacterium]